MKTAPCELWLLTGSQHLYGPQTLARVAADSAALAAGLGTKLPLPLAAQPVLTTPEEIRQCLLRASASPSRAAGVSVRVGPAVAIA